MSNVNNIPGYQSWHGMLRRCTWPVHKDYPKYGGRGIKIDPAWLNFQNFLKDMGEQPEGKTLERNDNNGDYCKNNCRWATPQEQNFNRRPHKNSTSGIVGVTAVSGERWRAYAKLNGTSFELYRGFDKEAAIQARKAWEEVNVKRA